MPLPDDEDMLDIDFPLGDGTADTGATVYCPYCNETVEIAIDPGGGSAQEYVEDCGVCCQPWTVSVEYRQDGTASVTVTPLDEETAFRADASRGTRIRTRGVSGSPRWRIHCSSGRARSSSQALRDDARA